MPQRQVVEFQCTNCSQFNYPKMNLTVNGNHKIICGNCDHTHYRVVKDGRITEDRWNNGVGDGETYRVMKSACQKVRRPKINSGVAAIRQAEAAGLHK